MRGAWILGVALLGWSIHTGACSASGGNTSFSSNSSNSNSGGGDTGGLDFGGNFHIGGNEGAAPPLCKVPPDMDDAVVPDCEDEAPADSFEPVEQWAWTAPPANPTSFYTGSFITPLVGNFSDDNGDGAIDLCDSPDILVSVVENFSSTTSAKLYLLDGATGTEKMVFNGLVDGFVYPAFGDIDNDGLPEVVAANEVGQLVVYEHDGTLKFTGPALGYRDSFSTAQCTAVAIYDIDADGQPEIIFGFEVFDNSGTRLWGVPGNGASFNGSYWCVTPTAADIDNDGKLEVLFGHVTYDDNGTELWSLPPNEPPGHPHVGNLDADPQPEVLITNMNGIFIVEHDGTVKMGPLRPTDPNPAPNCWGKPGVIHDFDGDGVAEIGTSTCTDYTVYEIGATDLTIKWSNPVTDFSGLATATAFDFLGDAIAEGVYADETQIYVFDGLTGMTNLTAPRTSGTLIEYPIVADIDNDASAEIVYVSNYYSGTGPTVQVTRDAMDRWIPARRIWNQYSYHVTNVREDGTIPQNMKNNWEHLNTFRVNSQIGAEGDCEPEPPN